MGFQLEFGIDGSLQRCELSLKASSDKKYADKENELDASRKNQQRQLASLQATIDAELKAKADMLKEKSVGDNKLIDLETALDAATKGTGDFQKTIKVLQIQNKDLAAQLATESEGRATARDAAIAADQRANELTTVNDEQRVALESADRARKAAEHDKLEATDRLADIQDMYNKAATAKRNAENDFHTLQSEVDEIENGAKAAEEKAARASAEVSKLLAKQNYDLTLRLEEAESGGSRTIKAQMRKLEN